ncbi:hypothetical protein PULV_a3473 [Pseudoalteromonas ulvae UL12]|nr:hypothetical protein [Pseudoalteromonas ulvae UL12]
MLAYQHDETFMTKKLKIGAKSLSGQQTSKNGGFLDYK